MESDICKRKRYNTYHANGTGLVPGEVAGVDLVIGTCCHKIVEELLSGKSEDDAILAGLDILESESRTLVRSTGAEFNNRPHIAALIELLGRVFARKGIPELLETYNLVSIEKEKPIILTEDIIMEVRADAELEDKLAGYKLAFSLKTCTDYAEWLMLRDRIALQNYTEPYAYDCDGVQMCYIIKGSKGDEFPFQGNTLLYPWHKQGQWSWNWKFINDQRENKVLGSTWSKTPIFEHMSIKEWLGYVESICSADAMMPYHRVAPWSRQLKIPAPTLRHPAEISAVMDSLKLRESDHFKRLAVVDETDMVSLERHFPREFTDCASLKGTCPYYNTCISSMLPSEMVEAGFKPRVPHHNLEEFLRGG